MTNATTSSTQRITELEKQLASYRAALLFMRQWHHEFRTPLSTIIGFPLLMLENTSSDEDREAYEAILTSGELMSRTIDRFFSFVSLEAGYTLPKKREVNIRGMLTALAERASRNNSENLSLEMEESLPNMIETDSSILQSLLSQLLETAYRRAKQSDAPQDKVVLKAGLQRENGEMQVWFSVADNGAGLEAQELKRWQRFFADGGGESLTAVAKKGALGLILCQRWACLLGGEITVKNRGGTLFTVALPYGNAAPRPL